MPKVDDAARRLSRFIAEPNTLGEYIGPLRAAYATASGDDYLQASAMFKEDIRALVILAKAALGLEFGPYPAHGSGFVTVVTAGFTEFHAARWPVEEKPDADRDDSGRPGGSADALPEVP